MKKAIFAVVLLASSAFAGPRIAVGIGFGTPAPVAVVRPACPGPGYIWIDGYYSPGGAWVPGFWRAPAVVVAPRVVERHAFAYDRDHDRGREVHRDFRR